MTTRKKPDNPGYDLVARLVVHGLPEMSKTHRRWIAEWLRDQANCVERGGNYAKRYTARYFR